MLRIFHIVAVKSGDHESVCNRSLPDQARNIGYRLEDDFDILHGILILRRDRTGISGKKSMATVILNCRIGMDKPKRDQFLCFVSCLLKKFTERRGLRRVSRLHETARNFKCYIARTMPVLPDKDYFLVGSDWNNINPWGRLQNKKIMSRTGSGGTGMVCPEVENPVSFVESAGKDCPVFRGHIQDPRLDNL